MPLHTGTVCTSFGGFGSNAYILFAARLLLLGLQLLLSLSYYFAINRGRGFTPIYISHFKMIQNHTRMKRGQQLNIKAISNELILCKGFEYF